MPLRRVCVFCDPDPNAGPEHRELAASVGWLLADNAVTLVYGGATTGAEGALAEAVLSAGASAVAVVTASGALQSEILTTALTERKVVATAEERNAALADLADGFLALPGAFASLEDLFRIWTWGQPENREKPCALLNRADYYTGLLNTPDDALLDRYVRESQRGLLIADRDPATLLRALADYRTPETRRSQPYEDS